MKLILHIGPPKTGTTTIQAALHKNREQLHEQGVFTFFGSKVGARALSSYYENISDPIRTGLRRSFASAAEVRAWSENSWTQLEQKLAASNADTALISSEHFAGVADFDGFADRLQSLFDDIRIITYLRDPISLYTSMIGSQIRSNGRRLRELPDPWRYNYPGLRKINFYADRFGAENIAVRNFDRQHMIGQDLLVDFFSTLDTQFGVPLDYVAPEKQSNETFCGAATAWLMTLNEGFVRLPSSNDKQVVVRRKQIIDRLRAADELRDLPKFVLPNETFKEAIRAGNHKRITSYNSRFLAPDQQMETCETAPAKPKKAETREMMADWILDYLTPEATPLVLRAALLPRPGEDQK